MIMNDLFTFTDADSHSTPICVLGSWDGNLTLTQYTIKSSIYYNVAIWFTVKITIGIRIRQCKSAIIKGDQLIPVVGCRS